MVFKASVLCWILFGSFAAVSAQRTPDFDTDMDQIGRLAESASKDFLAASRSELSADGMLRKIEELNQSEKQLLGASQNQVGCVRDYTTGNCVSFLQENDKASPLASIIRPFISREAATEGDPQYVRKTQAPMIWFKLHKPVLHQPLI